MRTDSGTLRLDPRFPVVWRTPTCLQIGVDRPQALFTTVSAAEERMLHALIRGVSVEGLRMIGSGSRAGARSVARLLDRVAPALVGSAQNHDRQHADSPTASPLAGATVALCGDSPPPALAGLLSDLGARVVRVADGVPPEPGADLAVIVSSWFTAPALAAVWLQQDVPHLDVVFSDTEVTIGPFVIPGRGACLHCRERYRIDADASWPAIAGQLLGTAAPTEVPLTLARVVPLVASFCLSARSAPGVGTRTKEGRVLHVDAVTGAVSESRQAKHPECACRALPGTSTEREPASDSPPSPPRRGADVDGPA